MLVISEKERMEALGSATSAQVRSEPLQLQEPKLVSWEHRNKVASEITSQEPQPLEDYYVSVEGWAS